MPRTGITEAQFLAAVEALEAQGEKITARNLRKYIGGGSNGTILPYLRAYRSKQSSSQESLTVLGPVPEEIQGLFAKAWSAAQTLAHAELAPQREALAIEAAGLKARIDQAEDENDEDMRELEIEMEVLKTQLSEANDKDKVTQTQLIRLSEEVGFLRAKLEASEAMMAERLAEKDSRLKLLGDSFTAMSDFRKDMGLPTPEPLSK